jgi:hypothetical protein
LLEEEQAILEGVGAPTILNAELASDDESGDDDFEASGSDSEIQAGPSGMIAPCAELAVGNIHNIQLHW